MIRIFAETSPGRVRTQNQDSYVFDIVDGDVAYALVCDGMGGENAGDIASASACRTIQQHLQKGIRSGLSEITVRNIIQSALSDANLKIYNMAKENIQYVGMGTTIVLAVVMGAKLYIASIGDSRIYIGGAGTDTRQLTTDHTVVQEMLANGEITQEEAVVHPKRHYVTKALGVEESLRLDYDLFEGLRDGMWVLLCSDGFSNHITLQTLPELVERAVAEDSARSLVDFANEQGGQDNITAVVIAAGQ